MLLKVGSLVINYVPLNEHEILWVRLTEYDCFCFVLCLTAYSEVSWQYTPPSVFGHVPGYGGERGHVPDRHEEHVQPQTRCPQEIRPEGRKRSSLLR